MKYIYRSDLFLLLLLLLQEKMADGALNRK